MRAGLVGFGAFFRPAVVGELGCCGDRILRLTASDGVLAFGAMNRSVPQRMAVGTERAKRQSQPRDRADPE